jgi:hypothetical protein
MKNYKCEYQFGDSKDLKLWKLEIQAESPRDAYEKFLAKVGFAELTVVVKSGLFKFEFFDDHLKPEAIEKRRKQNAINYLKFLEQKKQAGFFLLQTVDKVNAQLLFEEIISNSEKGPLFPEEVQYIEKWLSFKHRELGQSLLAQAEAQKPKDQQGTSQLGKLALAGVALSTMKLSQDIGAVSDQVENINEGLGFEG